MNKRRRDVSSHGNTRNSAPHLQNDLRTIFPVSRAHRKTKIRRKEGQRVTIKQAKCAFAARCSRLKYRTKITTKHLRRKAPAIRRRNVIDQQHIPKSYLIRTEFSDCGLMVRSGAIKPEVTRFEPAGESDSDFLTYYIIPLWWKLC
ncbi:hypothetical protein EVAR_30816_1 [Eumeta japonica]|uniref:Uncharacterized protein n=1 Tax=Eumeta variegata TaxID=151549 RepID=A0A4C2ABY6_EUMVA|nr:hypothetical protein EVAR_30816_1 [Eumeta japonica]